MFTKNSSYQDVMLRTVLQLMPSELQTSGSDYPNGKMGQTTKPERELAWRIAPTLFISFQYAWDGIYYAFRTQRNFRIHLVLGTLAIGLGIFLRLSAVEMAVVGLTIGAVLTMELLNTAIESVVDLTVKQNYHELAKVAKDCAAAAVLMAAIVAVGVAGSLMLPKLWLKLFIW